MYHRTFFFFNLDFFSQFCLTILGLFRKNRCVWSTHASFCRLCPCYFLSPPPSSSLQAHNHHNSRCSLTAASLLLCCLYFILYFLGAVIKPEWAVMGFCFLSSAHLISAKGNATLYCHANSSSVIHFPVWFHESAAEEWGTTTYSLANLMRSSSAALPWIQMIQVEFIWSDCIVIMI